MPSFMSKTLFCLLLFITSAAVAVALPARPPAGQVPSIIGNPKPFGLWLEEFRRDARTQGISEALLDAAFGNFVPDERVVTLDRKQPDTGVAKKTLTQYLAGVVTTARVEEGRRHLAENRELLRRIGAQYGVPPQYIMALWCIETSYGKITGNYNVPQALATLAYEGRRADFFRGELIKSLQIVQAGNIPLDAMKGSWAGAMGQSQFMPSSYQLYAVDEDGDGRKDIWNSEEDVFASIANYLSKSGWRAEHGWGRLVTLPADFNLALADNRTVRPTAQWAALGITLPGGRALPNPALGAVLRIPGTPGEGAFLVYDNYGIIMKWNHSDFFATAVGMLADEIAR